MVTRYYIDILFVRFAAAIAFHYLQCVLFQVRYLLDVSIK